MSKALSIYNEWAFYEVVLPAVANAEYSFLLDAERFHLNQNELVELECIQNQWYVVEKSNGCRIWQQEQSEANNRLPEEGRCYLRTFGGEQLAILVEEVNHPLAVYGKYPLTAGQTVTVGLDADNTLQYRYPPQSQETCFVSYHHCRIHYDGKTAVLEDTSSNGTYINNVRVRGKTTLAYGDHIRVFGLSILYLGNMLAVNHPAGLHTQWEQLPAKALQEQGQHGDENGSSEKNLFYRAPRSIPKMNTCTVSIDPPPNPRDIPHIPLFLQIGPAITMAIPLLMGTGITIMASRISGAAGSAFMFTGIITAVMSAVIGAFWAIVNVRHNKKQGAEEERRRFEKYGQYLIDKQEEIEKIYQEDEAALREKYLPSDSIARYDAKNEKLWARNFNHSDVLTYRLGIGDIPFPVQVEIQKEKFTMVEDALAEKPRQIRDRFAMMHRVPVCVNLRENSLIGVIGDVNSWAQILRNLIVQIAGNNSYTDVKIALVYDSRKISNPQDWEFAKWLPHVWSEDRKIRYFATNKNEAGEVFYALSQTLRTRAEEEQPGIRPYYILFVLNKELLEGELLTKYIGQDSSEIGLSTVIVAQHYEGLPNHCEFIIENNSGFAGVYSTTDETMDKVPVQFDEISPRTLMEFAKRLANIEINETETGGEVPESITFFDMYGISRPQDLHAEDRWRRAKTAESMKALIGVKSGGAPCYLDIHERYHGPHGLVAGTTGSGKSETLQTYLLSLAINYSPDDVGFFIIDYKGGGMANLFDGLPHMIGAISNLSGNQVKRAMVSIKSENKRRQRAFSQYGVNNINAYTALYKNGDAKEPIPHMFIIIDEFAELKREEPDFMRELVSVAQVGRSLGVHLILATQKPAGTVDDNIWSNSKFRLCLRVQDRQDSMDMLHRPDAAYLTQAGRGYLQVGNDELFELFQSGYSGATYDEVLGDKKLVVAQMLDPVGKIDLVGNHFKIQYQEEARRRWVETLGYAVEQAWKKVRQADGMGGGVHPEQLLEEIYTCLQKLGVDYKQSPYNDARLREFVALCRGTHSLPSREAADAIIRKAAEQRVKLPERKTKSQLEAVNEYLAEVAVRNGYTHTLRLWMPVLPDTILLTDIEGYKDFEIEEKGQKGREKHWTLSTIVGKGDDPENQSQMPVVLDFAGNGHHVLCGTVSTGKSTFLQTAVYGLLNKYTSEELNLYLIDFSSKLLTVFEDANQVGGVMTENEEDAEKIAKFFTMMSAIIAERKETLGSSTFQDYVEHSGHPLPAILIVVDNYAGFREKTDDKYEDAVKRIAKEGIRYGIYLLVSAGGFGTTEIPTRLADNFRTTLSLEMSDFYQYSDIMRVVRVPIYPESNIKGRGLVYYGDKIIEFQTALACKGESIFERNTAIRERVTAINQMDKGKRARRIPVIPAKPEWEAYTQEDEYAKLLADPYLLPNGYDAETAAYSALDLSGFWTYAVTGTKRSGKSNYLKTLIRASRDKQSQVCIIEIGSSEFARIAADIGCRYIQTGEEIYDFAKDVLLAEAGRRAGRKKQCMAQQLEDRDFFAQMMDFERICVFIPNAAGFAAELYNRESKAFQAANVYETLCGDKGAHYNIYFFTEISDNAAGDLMGYKVIANIRENGKGIRFGGRYLSQKFFSFANVPYKMQNNALKPGAGVAPSEEETAKLRQIITPMYRG